MQQVHSDLLLTYFEESSCFLLFTLRKAGQPLQAMELQEKETLEISLEGIYC